MRYGFVTCVRLGRACIEDILGSGNAIHMMMTLKDDRSCRKSGRIYLDDLAAEHGIPLHKIDHINDSAAVTALRNADLDWLFIVGWSQIANAEVLSSARRGVLGMHPTLLPEGRGRASIPWAILKQLDQTGVSLFRLAEGVDTGPVLAQQVIPLDADETAGRLYNKVISAHLDLLRNIWQRLEDGTVEETIQNELKATVWPGRRPEDGEILPESMSVGDVDRLVRATGRPYPGAFIARPDGSILRVWSGAPSAGEASTVELRLTDGQYAVDSCELETS
ncbi:MAG: methionyl-tRNA formyltransferase [Cellulomonas sp.]|uniref:formyltransferase family protein n=1 Tax=Cellulomonas sp. TaxID=40001 RepID=UPI0017A7CC9C|nr:formyltransferase family protein [Cellulomonas sp.]NMM30638.1 methionyl-tRNA formyltransferase [Cellulomonas sp.]